ncbi:hypothetical protein RQP53_12735 [Paucibacter sp. APW11]|uniref:Uncharacterized protein n=1 Tax=Roseateles aquae TaxID=3077235 RepID=A0ABU3PC31_9BURK|nr:hypothetical protein [Paucibacter sp. APW11]MDT9000135.1 hypothetical protein [Paucibacter sp. APW11]
MNDRTQPQEQQDAEQASVQGVDAQAVAVARRRRFLKIGASTVPAGLTLASRPVRAWHCNTTSAWGSAQINPVASTTNRNKLTQLTDETWTIANWQSNTIRTAVSGTPPWGVLFSTRTDCKSGGVVPAYVKSYTIGTLFSGASIPAGLSSTNYVWTVLNNGTQFQKYIVTAWLNAKLIANVASCLKSGGTDQLRLMLGGSYSPPNLSGTPWTQTDIVNYLFNNWIVRPTEGAVVP